MIEREFRLVVVVTAAFFSFGIAFPTLAQEAREFGQKYYSSSQAPGETECLEKLRRAVEAIDLQKEIIVGLEIRVRELVRELADCKELKERRHRRPNE